MFLSLYVFLLQLTNDESDIHTPENKKIQTLCCMKLKSFFSEELKINKTIYILFSYLRP